MAPARRRLRQRDERVVASDASSDDDGVEFLGVKRSSVQAAASASNAKGAEPPAAEQATSQVWMCPRCTFLNESADSARCEMCDSARPGGPPRKKTRKMMSQWLSQSPAPSAKKAKRVEQPINASDDEFADAPRSVSARTSKQQKTRAELKEGASGLWADMYAPILFDELCINKKKLEELREWLVRNASAGLAAERYPHQQRLLFLCGPPGAGKSTAVRCIARELGLATLEWGDNESAGRLNYDQKLHSEYYTPYVSSLDDFATFIRQSVSYSTLTVAPVTRRRPLMDSNGESVTHRKRRVPGALSNPVVDSSVSGHIVLVESWPQTWSSNQKAASEEKLQQIFRQVIDSTVRFRGFPIVCIFSDVRESKIALEHLGRKFSHDVVRSTFTTVININAVTAAVLKKNLLRVISREQCKISQSTIDRIVATANGDIRHALNMLQLIHNREPRPLNEQAGSTKTSTNSKKKILGIASTLKIAGVDTDSQEPIGRDAFLSDFHVLGKILHGKTISSTSSSQPADQQSTDYEAMITTSGMTIDRALAFVHENGVGYFSAVEGLSDALELLSFTENLVSSSYSSMGNSEIVKRASDVAQSLLIRSIAVTNTNPERVGFRPISGPKMFATNQRMVSRREDWLQRSLSGESSTLMHRYVCTRDAFIFEVEPFLSAIQAKTGSYRTGAPDISLESLQVETEDQVESDDDTW